MSTAHNPRQNHLLAALPASDFDRMQTGLKLVPLPLGEVLYESGSELIMTQELIANMLGVRREGVTEAAGNLQAAGLIKYSRGHITVVDRAGLEARTCECYAVVKKESDRLLPNRIAS
jgi:hypothetical protein